MTENLHLVFSKPPEAISDEEYNRWYDFHLGEILMVPGFTSARRYRLQTVKGDWTPSGHRYLSAYEIEGDPRDVMNELDKEVASGVAQPVDQDRHQVGGVGQLGHPLRVHEAGGLDDRHRRGLGRQTDRCLPGHPQVIGHAHAIGPGELGSAAGGLRDAGARRRAAREVP